VPIPTYSQHLIEELRQRGCGSGRPPYIDASELAAILGAEPHPGLPPWLNTYLRDFLRGRIPKPKGRKQGGAAIETRNEFIVFHYRRYLSWLQRREKSRSLTGWAYIKNAEWWQGAVHERAAAMTLERMHKSDWWKQFLPLSPRCVQNLSSSQKYRYIEVNDPSAWN